MPDTRTITDQEFDQIKHHIQDIRIALLTTQAPTGALRTRPMATHQLDPDGTMWFFTRQGSQKVAHIREHSAIALGFSNPQSHVSVSTAGHAEVITDQAKVDALWDDSLRDWFPEGKDDPDIVLLRITTLAGECWE
ncbi:pyridoxamine 5'-phosphate oxidase family protein [Spirosoma luteum]|uniref:pyridoxamine 5'-phosphate oxidase family protein n=1 Tax=Spirosoma luteum TaxID=431553 RepID=UPI000365B437|nr:pyridoxamine 5'-phosphate oxidase family protein [Spirosoma luteum]